MWQVTLGAYWWIGIRVARGLALDLLAWLAALVGWLQRQGRRPALIRGRERFYQRHLYGPWRQCWHRPLAGPPDREAAVVLRDARGRPTGAAVQCVNLASYNYLGCGATDGAEVAIAIARAGVGAGDPALQRRVERRVARMLRQEACVVSPMGFSANSRGLPALVAALEPPVTVLSDRLNHRSIVQGLRGSGARVRTFAHNSTADVERLLKEADGPGTRLIVTEGLFSMEGDYCPLRELARLKRRYGALLYLDEAHSIGAVGPRGRGLVEREGVWDVDVLVGTFSKSFAAVGGYLAASRELVDRVRRASDPPELATGCCRQVLCALDVLDGGGDRLARLRANTRRLRDGLARIGACVLGPPDSPVVPLMLCHPGRMMAFAEQTLARGIAVVVVGPPATPLLTCRARFCVSAAHTPQDIDRALAVVARVGAPLGILAGQLRAWAGPTVLVRAADPADDDSEEADDDSEDEPEADAPALPLARPDPLGLATAPDVVDAACGAVASFGVGACGPRGFYGTTTAHLALEDALCKFLGTDGAVLYPHGSCVLGSMLQSYLERGDVVAVPAGCRAAPDIQLTGATVREYGDAASLRRAASEPRPRGARLVAVLEGCSEASELAPLPDLLAAAGSDAHVVVDESRCLGVLGRRGRGALEHHGLDCRSVDLVVGAFEPLGGVGGFVAGPHHLVEHQRLASPAYSFSAASPAYTAVAATAMLARDSATARRHLHGVARRVHDRLADAVEQHPAWSLLGSAVVPTKTLHWRGPGLERAHRELERAGLASELRLDHSTVRLHLRHTLDHGAMDRIAALVAGC